MEIFYIIVLNMALVGFAIYHDKTISKLRAHIEELQVLPRLAKKR
jgi:hypothetical protein